MSDIFWSTLPMTIASIATLATSLAALSKLNIVHGQIDGMKTELVASTAKASLAEGRAAGVKEEQDRVDTKSEPQEVHVVNTPSDPLPVVSIKNGHK